MPKPQTYLVERSEYLTRATEYNRRCVRILQQQASLNVVKLVQKSTPDYAASQKSLSHIATITEGILVNKPVQKQWSVVYLITKYCLEDDSLITKISENDKIKPS